MAAAFVVVLVVAAVAFLWALDLREQRDQALEAIDHLAEELAAERRRGRD